MFCDEFADRKTDTEVVQFKVKCVENMMNLAFRSAPSTHHRTCSLHNSSGHCRTKYERNLDFSDKKLVCDYKDSRRLPTNQTPFFNERKW